jgi:hypothetical protein
MQNDVYAEDEKLTRTPSRLYIPLERLWSLFTFYLGGKTLFWLLIMV